MLRVGKADACQLPDIRKAQKVPLQSRAPVEDDAGAQKSRMARSPAVLHVMQDLEPQVRLPFLAQFPRPQGRCLHKGREIQGSIAPPQELHLLSRHLNLGIVTRLPGPLHPLDTVGQRHCRLELSLNFPVRGAGFLGRCRPGRNGKHPGQKKASEHHGWAP